MIMTKPLLVFAICYFTFYISTAQNKPFEYEPKMLLVPAGTFTMGDILNDDIEPYGKPTHSVILDSFYIGKYEISQAEWVAIMDTNPSSFRGFDLPVENVSWEDIQIYLQKLNIKTHKNYRLPTEAEWEYAAREGGKNIRFSNGKNTIDPAVFNFNASKANSIYYSIVGEYRGKTVAVNSFYPNSLGLYNMSGNVWEWCSDWYGDYGGDLQHNPTGAKTGHFRVLRGGSWSYNPQYCRTTVRSNAAPTDRFPSFGFRVVRSFQ